MSRRTAVCEVIHIVLLSLCVGAMLMVGAVAAVAFPTAHRLNPTLPGLEAYTGEHWVLAAGSIMARSFQIAGFVQYACVFFAAVAFSVARWPRRDMRIRKLTLTRIVMILALVAVSAYQCTILRPRMDTNLDAMWAHAKGGDNAAALVSKAAFDADHGPARNVLEAGLGLALLNIALAGWAAVGLTQRSSERPA